MAPSYGSDGMVSETLKLKRKVVGGVEVPSKKAKMIPTPDMSSLDEGSDCTGNDNGPDEAQLEKSNVPEMLTPRTTSMPSTPKLKYESETKKFPCIYPDCPKLFNRPAKLADHMRSHSNDRPFKCTYEGCDKSFKRRTSLKDHVQCLHTRVRDHACQWEGCDKRFRTSAKLKKHISIHEGRERFRCTGYPPCDEIFRKHQTLQRHIASVHLGQMPYPCTKIDPITNKPCTEGFKQGTQLRVHVLRYHSGIRFWCHECKVPASGDEGEIAEPRELGFHTYELFERHKRLVHPPNCALCPKVCSTQSELRRHIEAQHSDTKTEKPRAYRCQATGCCREFTKRSNLKVHIRSVHDHIRSFVCGKTDLISSKITEGWDGQGACGKDFAAKRALEEHVRIQHMGLDACRNRNVQGNKKGRDVSGETVKGSSMIARLTGIGYEENRHIPCLYPSCSSRFFRQYDLEIHMKAKHCLSGGEIIELFVEKEALSGGRFWFGADVQDEEYWDWDLEDTAAFDRERTAEGDAEMTQRADRDKCHILDSDSQEMVGEGTVTAFQVMHDRPMEDRGAEFGDYEMFIDPVLRSL